MTDNQATRSGNILAFVIQSADGTKSIDISGGVSEIKYYENILSNSISMTTELVDSGFNDSSDEELKNKGIVDGLPLRGGERSFVVFEDNQETPNKLEFRINKENSLYINRVRNISPGTQKDIFSIDFCTREHFANEQSRVVKRYDGNISDNVKAILTEPLFKEKGLLSKKQVKVDDTLIDYNFIGNDRKPFYVCTWLASKSVPKNAGQPDGAAGYLFYETYDGYNFRSIDALFKQKYKKKYVYTNTELKPEEYDAKVLSYNIERDIDLSNNLTLGTYANRSIFFDFFAMDYKVREYTVDDNQKDKIVNGGLDEILSVSEEFRKPVSRLMSHVLDIGTLPKGKNIDEQLANWKDSPFNPTYDAARTMVQSIMRYNQMFLIKISVVIPGDFSLRAGDLVHCDFPGLTIDRNAEVNKKSGGIYMIASLCHRITPRETFTSMTLVRDSFGRKPF